MTEKREPLCSYFAFYPSYYEAITEFVPEEHQLEGLKAFIEYGLYGVEPSGDLPEIIRGMFKISRPTIDKHLRDVENGKKGGRPPKKEDEKTGVKTGVNTGAKTKKEKEKEKDIEREKDISFPFPYKDTESAAAPAPNGGGSASSPFTFADVLDTIQKYDIDLTEAEARRFYDWMEKYHWQINRNPVSKLENAIRGWAKKHHKGTTTKAPERKDQPAKDLPKREPTVIEKAAAIWNNSYASDRDPCKMLSTWRYHIGNKLLDLMIRNDVSEGDIICFCFCLEDAGLPAASGSGEISSFYELFNQYNDLYKWICENWNDVFRIIGKNYDSDAKYDQLKAEYFKLLADKEAETAAAEKGRQKWQTASREEIKTELFERLQKSGLSESDFMNLVHKWGYFSEEEQISALLNTESDPDPDKRFLSGFAFIPQNWEAIERAAIELKQASQ